MLKITQRSEMCIKNFYSVNHISLCYNVIEIIKSYIKSYFIIHTTNIQKKFNKKFVSSKKNLTFALEMFETTMNSGNKSYPHIKQN